MMQLYIKWSKKYTTGIPILDEQQRGLVSLINTFFFHKSDADEGGNIHAVLVPTAMMFRIYIKVHFGTVDKLLRDSGYPAAAEYHAYHERVLKEISRTDRKHKRARDADGFLRYLRTFWQGYISKPERPYVQHLLEYYESSL